MSDSITVRGFVATEIKSSTTTGGVPTASFRLGATERRFDRGTSTWVDGNTNWFTVQGYRQLAGNMGCSVKKGQRVIVVGRLRMRSWEKDGRFHHAAEIDADALGHDLMWGSANFTRNAAAGQQQADGPRSAARAVDTYPGYSGQGDGEGVAEPEGGGEAAGEGGGAGPGAVFVDDATGSVSEVDEETGELREEAA